MQSIVAIHLLGQPFVRYVWQTAEQAKRNGASRFQLNAFTSRLRWQAHFIQKFEMEDRIEFESINKGFASLKKSQRNLYTSLENRTDRLSIDRRVNALLDSNRLYKLSNACYVGFFFYASFMATLATWRQASGKTIFGF